MTGINTAATGKNDRSTRIKIYTYTALFSALGIIMAVFMTYCQIHHTHTTEIASGTQGVLSYSVYDASVPKILTYFEDSPAVSIFVWSSVIIALLAILLPTLTIPKCDLKCEAKNSVFMVFASSLLGFLFAGYVVNLIITPLRHLWTEVQFPSPDFSLMTPMLKLIYYAGVVFAIPCAVYFLLIATQNEFKPGTRMCLLSVCPVIWLSLRLIFYFMSTSAHVNLSGRKMYIVSLVLAIIFFIQDAKRWIPTNKSDVSTEKSTAKQSKLFFAAGLASIVTFSAYHLSTTYLQVFWIFKNEDSYLLNGIFISMILYIAFRLVSIKKTV